jgi:hypothetical protein
VWPASIGVMAHLHFSAWSERGRGGVAGRWTDGRQWRARA